MTQVQHNVYGTFAPDGGAIDRLVFGRTGNSTACAQTRPAQPDGVACAAWTPTAASPQPAPAAFGIFQSLVDDLDSAVRSLSSWLGQVLGEARAEGDPVQNVRNATLSSVGDPHLAESGQLIDGSGAAQSVEAHFDSMSAHDNLLSSQDFDGGYRLSTTVTPPDANGVTMNQSATVHANAARDSVTMNNDGTVEVVSDGSGVEMQSGQSLTLAGGELVKRDADGSLTVAQTNAAGGSISTTMRANGGGVDVTTTVQNATVGGDIARGALV